MKTFKRIIKALLFLLIVTTTCLHATYAQDEKQGSKAAKATHIKSLIDSQNFVFVPQSVLPMRGALRQLSPDYDIRLSKDSLVSYLPYFGRAYTAPLDPTNIGFNFTSTKFEHTKTNTKKGYDISIKPKDYTEVRELSFRIFDNGSASLQITSQNRDPISFQGYISERKQKE